MKITITASLLVGTLLLAAAVVMVTPVRDWLSDNDRPVDAPATAAPVVDLERRIVDYADDVVADAGYLPPNRAQRETVAEGVALYIDGKRTAAARTLAEVDFGVRILRDTAHGRRFAEIADQAAESRRGWGRVYIALDAPVRFAVQVPHPVADADSEALGVGVLRGVPGGVLVIAGTHRNAGDGDEADVAHRRDTVFHAVCAGLVERSVPGIQVHGFAEATAPDHDVIVSTGAGDDGRARARTLARALSEDEFRVCRAWVRKCPLEGRTNRQGRLAAEEDLPFLHVEFSREIRESRELRARVVAAMTTAVAE